MFKDRVTALLKIRPDEMRLAWLVAALFLCVQAGQGIGENAAFALFLARVNVDNLPYMYMGLGGVVFLASVAYSASLSRFQNASVVIYLMAGSVVLFTAEWTLIVLLGNSVSYPILWLTTYGMSVIIGTLLWTVAGKVCDARQAKRLFPLFASTGILGSVIGNLLTGVFANLAGANNLVVLYAILLGVGFFLTREIANTYFKPETITALKFSLVNDVRAGYEFARGSQLFRIVAYCSILYSVLFFTVDFPFSEIVSNQYQGNEAGLAGFKGLFTSITTAVTFLVSLLLANRVYMRLGIVNSILIMPVTYVVCFVVFFVSFTLSGAVFARFSQLVMLGGVAGTAWNALFNVAPPERRGQILAFNNGVPAQIGVVLSGLLIILSRQALSTQAVLLLGVVVALVTVYLTIKMKPAYGEALLSALRAGRAEVFSDQEEAFSGYQNDPAAIQVILKALEDSKAYTRRLAVEMLAKMRVKLAIPDLLGRLSDEDASVRAATIKALTQLGAKPVTQEIILRLDDPDDIVREETLASLPKLEVASSPKLVRSLERLLKDSNLHIRAHAAVVLIFLKENQHSQLLLSRMIKDEDVNKRRIALDAYEHIAANARDKKNLPFKVDLILNAMNDSSAIVRREAVRVASLLNNALVHAPIVKRLSDEDASVRKAASESLKQAWAESRPYILQILKHTDGVPLDSALDSIPQGDPEIFDLLRGYIQREVSNIRDLRELIASLHQDGSAVRLLCETLQARESLSEERMIKAVGLFGNPRALELIRKTLNAGDAGTRAAALEAFETLGDRQITQMVLPILDRGGVFHAENDQTMTSAQAIEILLSDEDYWLRALAARSIPDIGLQEFIPVLRKLKSDRVLFVKHAARDALARMDGEVKMKTLKTLSTLERILLLREVPMFAKLSPEDLEQIAEIAHEGLYSNYALICREGDPGNTMFIIVNGMVDVVKRSGKKETKLGTRKAGEFVGEMAILESAPRSATLRAQGEVRVLEIGGVSFHSILLDRPVVAVSVLRHMSNRVRELSEMVGAPSEST